MSNDMFAGGENSWDDTLKQLEALANRAAILNKSGQSPNLGDREASSSQINLQSLSRVQELVRGRWYNVVVLPTAEMVFGKEDVEDLKRLANPVVVLGFQTMHGIECVDSEGKRVLLNEVYMDFEPCAKPDFVVE